MVQTTKKNKDSRLRIWQMKAQEGGECMNCHVISPRLTVDHIVPVAFLEGLDETGYAKYDDEDNFQLLCKPCNSLKGGKLDKRNPKTREIILRYL